VRRLLVLALAALLAPPTDAPEEPEWLAYLRSDGALVAVPLDGGPPRTLFRSGVAAFDLLPGPRAVAVRNAEGGTEVVETGLDPGSVRRLPGPPGSRVLRVAGASTGEIALSRLVAGPPAPRHLSGRIDALARTTVVVLAPTERPPGTTATVAEASRDTYRLLFTNDPRGRLSHAEQVNVFVSARRGRLRPPPEAGRVRVRGHTGWFSCGAAACFVDWSEDGIVYSIGEFGSPTDAAAFAASLVPLERWLGPGWRSGRSPTRPQLVVASHDGTERVVAADDPSCACRLEPVDWSDDGRRLLAIRSREGSTSLHEHPARGGAARPVFEDAGAPVLDAAYGPGGVLLLVGRGDRGGTLRDLGGTVIERGVRSFDAEGGALAWVDASGRVLVRSLPSGETRVAGRDALEIALVPIAASSADPPTRVPLGWIGIGVGAGLGLVLLLARTRRAKRSG
jgi:hypothetical protein